MKKDPQSTPSQKATTSKKSVKETASETTTKSSAKMTAAEKTPKTENKAAAKKKTTVGKTQEAKSTPAATPAKKATSAKTPKAPKSSKAGKDQGNHSDLVNKIKNAVSHAGSQYHEHHAGKENKASKNVSRRNSAGYLNAAFQKEKSLYNAQLFLETIQAQEQLYALMTEMRRFLSHESSSFYPHSFACYVAHALAGDDLMIVKAHYGARYEKQAVVRELSKWTARNI